MRCALIQAVHGLHPLPQGTLSATSVSAPVRVLKTVLFDACSRPKHDAVGREK